MALEDATNPMQGVSGPGSFAKRTDLQYQPDAYGAGVQYAADKAGAPLAKSGGVKLSQAPRVPAGNAPAGVGLYDPTQRPNEPVTHGIDVAGSAGGGSDVLMMRQPDDSEFRMSIEAAKPVLAYISDLPNTSPETRAALKELWDMQ
jgi:hypothetical protein